MISLSKEKGMGPCEQSLELNSDKSMDTISVIPDKQEKFRGKDANMWQMWCWEFM